MKQILFLFLCSLSLISQQNTVIDFLKSNDIKFVWNKEDQVGSALLSTSETIFFKYWRGGHSGFSIKYHVNHDPGEMIDIKMLKQKILWMNNSFLMNEDKNIVKKQIKQILKKMDMDKSESKVYLESVYESFLVKFNQNENGYELIFQYEYAS